MIFEESEADKFDKGLGSHRHIERRLALNKACHLLGEFTGLDLTINRHMGLGMLYLLLYEGIHPFTQARLIIQASIGMVLTT